MSIDAGVACVLETSGGKILFLFRLLSFLSLRVEHVGKEDRGRHVFDRPGHAEDQYFYNVKFFRKFRLIGGLDILENDPYHVGYRR